MYSHIFLLGYNFDFYVFAFFKVQIFNKKKNFF